MRKLILILALGLIAIPAAAAQKRPALTGDPIADIKNAVAPQTVVAGMATQTFTALAKPFQDLAAFIGDDVNGAIVLSTAIPGLQDGHGQQCYIALRNYSAVFKAHPLPATLQVATDFEALRLLAMATNQLCANTHCTQVFADATSMAQAAAGPINSALIKVPSLHDICALIPQIAVVDPVLPVPADPGATIAPIIPGVNPAPAAPATPK